MSKAKELLDLLEGDIVKVTGVGTLKKVNKPDWMQKSLLSVEGGFGKEVEMVTSSGKVVTGVIKKIASGTSPKTKEYVQKRKIELDSGKTVIVPCEYFRYAKE